MSSSSDDRNPVEILAEEFLARFRRGERPSLSEYTAHHPDLASDIRELFPALVMLEDVRPPAVHSTDALNDPAALTARTLPLQQLGDYRILRELGRGGMGIVYEAEQESLGRHVALKVLLGRSLLDPRHLQRFQREAKAAARLHHTNIVPVFGVGEHEGLHYYVMQFIHGQGLDQVLLELQRLHRTRAVSSPEDQPIPAPESAAHVAQSLLGVRRQNAVPDFPSKPSHSDGKPPHSTPFFDEGRPYWHSVARIGLQSAEGLAHAHAQGLLHRDIKPSNLLLDIQGIVWITDFGLAKSADSEDLTHTGDVVGTLRYLAPERFHGQADARSDVYALGLTLYEMLTLQPAFGETDRTRLLHQVMHAEPLAPRKLNPAVPRDLETIVLKAIARDPAHRYAGAAELAEDLRRFLDDKPILARPVSEAEKAWRWCRRNPVLAAALAAVVLTVTVAFVWIYREKNEALEQRNVAEALADEKAELVEKERKASSEANAALAKQIEATKARDAATRRTQAVNDYFIHGMLGSADPRGNRGQTLTVREVLDRAAAGVKQKFADEPDLEEASRDALGRAYLAVGEPRKALDQMTIRVELCRQLRGETHSRTLAARAQRVTTLKACFDHAAVVKESAPLLPLLRQTFGAEHHVTLQLMEETARSLSELRRAAEGLPIEEEVVAIRQRLLGPEHPSTLQSLSKLAYILAVAGKAAEGFRICEQQLPVFGRVLGKDHLDTLMLRNHRARCLLSLGRLAEAWRECEELLPVLRRTAGPDHFDVLILTNNLACVRMLQKQFAEANRLFDECLPPLRRLLGDDNSQVMQIAACHAVSLSSSGKLVEAEAVYEKLLPAQRRALPASESALLGSLTQYGMVLQKQSRFGPAEPVWREVVERRRKSLPAGHWQIGEAEMLHGACLVGIGRFMEAEKVMLAGHDHLTAANNPRAPVPMIMLARRFLAILYNKWDKPDKAAEWSGPLPKKSDRRPAPAPAAEPLDGSKAFHMLPCDDQHPFGYEGPRIRASHFCG